MLIDLRSAELHTPIIVGGKNLGLKLDAAKLTGLGLQYDRAEKELLVTYGGETAIIPSPTVVKMMPFQSKVQDDEPQAGPQQPLSTEQREKAAAQAAMQKAAGLGKAQVSTPTSHVFEGAGKK